MKFIVVVAIAKRGDEEYDYVNNPELISGGIGLNGKIPWPRNKRDMQHFSLLTKQEKSVCIVGRKTFEGMPVLKGRKIYVLSRSGRQGDEDNVSIFRSCYDVIDKCMKEYRANNLTQAFIIGGSQIYETFMKMGMVDEVYLSVIKGYDDDDDDIDYYSYDSVFSMEWLPSNLYEYSYICGKDDESDDCCILHYSVINRCENRQMELEREILSHGSPKGNTLSLFGKVHRYPLKCDEYNILPIMTSKKVFFRGVFEELMMFLRGHTDTKTHLSDKGIKIWEANTSREQLDKLGLMKYNVGEMGPAYGESWRRFAGVYDQLAELIKVLSPYESSGGLKTKEKYESDLFGRRHIISLWEPQNLSKVTLPPCLFCYQFNVRFVRNKYILDCIAIQRSLDTIVAHGWNIATISLLTHLIAYFCNLVPGEVIHVIGDAHIYNNTKENVDKHLSRSTYTYPHIVINATRSTDNTPDSLLNISYDNIKLIGYRCGETIKSVINTHS